MVTLASAAVIHDFVATVRVSDADQLIGYFFYGLVPSNFLEGSILHFLQRRGQAIAAVLVMVNSKAFFARVTLACRMVFIATHPSDLSSVDSNLNTAIG